MTLGDCPDLWGISEAGVSWERYGSAAVFQAVEKHEATQAIICTILSASNTSLWRLLLEGFYGGAGGRGQT